MKRRKFKDPRMQKIYDWFRDNRPNPEIEKLKGSCGNAYYVGYKFPSKRSFSQRNSLAYPAWAAGVDNSKEK